MTPEYQRLVRASFAKVAPIAPAAAAMFYERLFTLDPALRPLCSRRSDGVALAIMSLDASSVRS